MPDTVIMTNRATGEQKTITLDRAMELLHRKSYGAPEKVLRRAMKRGQVLSSAKYSYRLIKAA